MYEIPGVQAVFKIEAQTSTQAASNLLYREAAGTLNMDPLIRYQIRQPFSFLKRRKLKGILAKPAFCVRHIQVVNGRHLAFIKTEIENFRIFANAFFMN